MRDPDGRDPLVRKLRLARLALFWEGLWPAVWPALAVAGGFLVVALLDLLPYLPVWAHGAALAVFGGLLALAFWPLVRGLTRPSVDAAKRRLEAASGLKHRPLTALDDKLSMGGGDALTRRLWQAHLRRMRDSIRALRVGWPAPGLPARDPRAYRAALVLLLAVGLGVAGSQAWTRVGRAFTPGIAQAPAAPGLLDLWVTPPAYTGLAPRPLLPPANPAAAAEAVVIPTGSQLLAQVAGGSGTPQLKLDDKAHGFQPFDGGKSHRMGTTVEGGTRLTVVQGNATLGDWTISVVPDAAPKIDYPTAPQRSRRSALRIDFEATDDYGLATALARITRTEPPKGQEEEAIELPLPLAGLRATEAKGASYHDLTAHPWAGLPVVMQLRAIDGLGQIGVSSEFKMVMPERTFQHPVARAIVEQRKALIGDPAQRANVARALAAIAAVPRAYFEDTVVYLALRMAGSRLMHDANAPATDAVQSLLWDTALRIEDGKLSMSERDLRALQQKLQEAIANNAPDAEIERLMQELQQAIDRYLEALMENARRNPQQAQRQRLDRNAQRLDRNDLQRMLDQARQMARTGARDAARDMLSRLQDMLENLRAGQQAQPGEMQEGEGEAGEMMQSLQNMIQRQQQLLDRSFRRSQRGQRQPGQRGQPGQQGQQGQQPGEGEGEGDGDAAEQEALRRELGELMRQLGEMMGNVPAPFGRADRSMRDAGDALGRNAPGRALRPQTDALDQLRSAARQLQQEMADRFGQGEGEPEDGDFNDQANRGRDPAGRPMDGLGGFDGNDVNIPDEAEVQRSRQILDELLRRAGERYRPAVERDYIERLLKRF